MEIKEYPKNDAPINVKHFCNPGDLIATMAGLRGYWERNGKKCRIYHQLNLRAEYYPGATHGTLSDEGTGVMVCMNKHIYDMIRPLVISQEYIEDMQVFEGQDRILIDIDEMRRKTFVNLPHGSIQSWAMYAFPDLAFNLSRPWVELPEKDIPIVGWIKDKIILNFTERYRNPHISYFFLRKFKNRLVFAGTEREYLLFVNTWKLDIPKLDVKDFLELAYAIKNCKFLLSNQSLCWNIAEAMKSPRILEVCEKAVNCLPYYGDKSYGFYHQEALEYYVDEILM